MKDFLSIHPPIGRFPVVLKSTTSAVQKFSFTLHSCRCCPKYAFEGGKEVFSPLCCYKEKYEKLLDREIEEKNAHFLIARAFGRLLQIRLLAFGCWVHSEREKRDRKRVEQENLLLAFKNLLSGERRNKTLQVQLLQVKSGFFPRLKHKNVEK